MSYRLQRRQVVRGSVPEVFAFFKNPRSVDDVVDDELPLGLLHSLAVQRQLQAIVDYRALHIARRFPNRPTPAGMVAQS